MHSRALISLLLLSSCANVVGDVETDKASPPVCESVDLALLAEQTDRELGEPGETTASRAAWLTRYAQNVLAAEDCEIGRTLHTRGYEGRPLNESYRISVRAERDGCFDDEGGWSLLDDQSFDAAKTQIDRFTSFLRDFHVAMDGRPTLLFDSIRFCPRSGWPLVGDHLFRLDQSVLTVGVYQTPILGGASADSGRDMREAWKDGAFMEGPLQDYWFVINPVSTGRVVGRRIIREGAERLGIELDRARVSGASSADSRVNLLPLVERVLQNAFGSGVVGQALGEVGSDLVQNHSDIRARIVARLNSAEPTQLEEIAQLWKEFMQSPENVEGVAQALIATVMTRSSYNLSVNQGLCGVAIGNFHNINVDVHTLFPKARRFMRYAELREVPQNLNIDQWLSLFCLYTVDDINVSARFSGAEGTLELAGLEYAIDAVLGAE